ncbi:MAG TPA: FapA family protein, partial [Bacilli bacterium]|nr:FapA family protein [Bacilli bacterium]
MEVKVLMMRAKTARDALLQASKQLQVPLETLRAHLLEEGRRSFFRPRTNLYQITEKQVEPQTVEEMSEMAERHGLPAEPLSTDRTTGLIWVRDGQVSCSEDKYYLPFLSPCPGLDVRVNGKSINGPTIVSESDIVEVEPIFELVETTISVELSEDLMQAILEIRHGYKLFRSVKDQEPAQELILEVEESKIKNPPVTPELIYEHLARRGIVHGFDDQQIRTACQSQEDICCVIAQGTATIAGIDGEIELYVNKKHAQHAVLSRSDLALWKEIVSQYTVSPGEVIGVVVPPVPGKEGINVLGDVIPPTVGREVQIVAGHGVEVIGEPRKIVAIQAGRVEVEHLHENTYRLSIVQQYVHTGAVNLTTGPIRFKGDVFILGDVEEGMTVEA